MKAYMNVPVVKEPLRVPLWNLYSYNHTPCVISKVLLVVYFGTIESAAVKPVLIVIAKSTIA